MDHMHHAADPSLTWHDVLTTFSPSPGWTPIALALLAAYLLGLRAGRRRDGTSPGRARIACFVAGIAVWVWTTGSAIDERAMSAFWVHMVEHLLLIMVVPLLLALGLPLTVLREALEGRRRARLERVLARGPVALLTHPLVALALYSVVIVGTHLTSFMDQMTVHGWVMPAEEALYLVTGYLYWTATLGGEPLRWQVPVLGRIGLMLIGMSPDTFTGIVLMQAESLVAPEYYAMRPAGALDPLRDQYVGGSIMWFFGDGLMMVAALVLMIDLIAHPSRHRGFGAWLDGVRRATLAEHVERSGAEGLASASDGDDDAALEAYNRMLARLNAADEQRAERGR